MLIVIDTFQMIRGNTGEPSYGGDYEEIQKLKRIADSQRVAILLVHHLRKQGDPDPFNKLSGTTGITGAVDTVFVLDRSRCQENGATLFCTGRDIEYRELELRFSKEKFVWELMADSAKERMNRWKYTLEDLGVYFEQTDSTPGKVLDVWYVPPSETSHSSQKSGP